MLYAERKIVKNKKKFSLYDMFQKNKMHF